MGGCEVVAEGLVKVYGAVRALDGVSIEASGGFTAIMGPNGSGKTTALSIIAGVVRPTRGRVRVCGYDVWGGGWRRARELMGFAPQDPPFNERLTLLENLVVMAGLRGMSPGAARAEALRLLEDFGLRGLESRRVGSLSGGERRRASIVLSLLHNPEVVVLDEPGSGLDPRAKEELWGYLRRGLRGRVVLYSTHDPGEAEGSGYVYVLYKGRVAASGRPIDLIRAYAPRPRVRVSLYEPLRGPVEVPGARLLRLEGSIVEYEVADPSGSLPGIIEGLLEAGAGVSRVEVLRPGMREVYMAVTGEEPEV